MRRALQSAADPAAREWSRKYFLDAIDFIGVKAPQLKTIERALRPTWASAPRQQQVALAFELLRSAYMEERQVALLILGPHMKHLGAHALDESLDDIEGIFDAHVRDWATCDGLCGRALRPLLVLPRARKRIMAWSRTPLVHPACTWKQRASAVAFVNEAKHGHYDDDIIEVCARIVKNQERFVQLGCGWVLRELSLVDRPRVLAFIDEHAKHLSREGLRYATEKLPASVKQDVHARHATRSGRGRP